MLHNCCTVAGYFCPCYISRRSFRVPGRITFTRQHEWPHIPLQTNVERCTALCARTHTKSNTCQTIPSKLSLFKFIHVHTCVYMYTCVAVAAGSECPTASPSPPMAHRWPSATAPRAASTALTTRPAARCQGGDCCLPCRRTSPACPMGVSERVKTNTPHLTHAHFSLHASSGHCATLLPPHIIGGGETQSLAKRHLI
jgi:hypothetical protein